MLLLLKRSQKKFGIPGNTNSRTFSRTLRFQGLFKDFSRTFKIQGLFKDRKNPVKGKLASKINFQCSKCSEPQVAIDTKNDKKGLVLDQNVEFESVDRFCYLGDMISAGGGAELSSRMRVRC